MASCIQESHNCSNLLGYGEESSLHRLRYDQCRIFQRQHSFFYNRDAPDIQLDIYLVFKYMVFGWIQAMASRIYPAGYPDVAKARYQAKVTDNTYSILILIFLYKAGSFKAIFGLIFRSILLKYYQYF